jgi:hypothetical protein
MLGSSLVATQLATSQEGLSSMELRIFFSSTAAPDKHICTKPQMPVITIQFRLNPSIALGIIWISL